MKKVVCLKLSHYRLWEYPNLDYPHSTCPNLDYPHSDKLPFGQTLGPMCLCQGVELNPGDASISLLLVKVSQVAFLLTFVVVCQDSSLIGGVRHILAMPVFSDHIQGQLLPNISSQIQIVLIWGAPYKAKSLCPNMGYPISGQTDFVPIRAARGR